MTLSTRLPGRARSGPCAFTAADVRALTQDRAAGWFPELGTAPAQVAVEVMSDRPRCRLYDVRLGFGAGPGRADQQRRVVVKVRGDAGVGAAAGRPSLVPDQVGAAEQAALEHAGLRRVEALIDPVDTRFAAVRALDLLAQDAVLVLEHVGSPTLRDLLLSGSRVAVRPELRRLRGTDRLAWRNAGSWLALLHGRADPTGSSGAVERLGNRAEVLERFAAYGVHLAGRPGGAAAAGIAERAAELAGQVLPVRLSLALGHGDFAPRNVFVQPAGRVAVFDPMPRWRAPVLEDLCRFLVGVRLVGLQLHSRGAAFSTGRLDAVEREFLAGYGDEWAAIAGAADDAAPTASQLTAFRLLVLLDKWSALSSGAGVLGRARVRWVAGHLRSEAERLLRSESWR